ncbi:MAG: hypothetical protein ABI416_20150 [Ginsengibacter sp.]
MAITERTTQPSPGSNDVGAETTDSHLRDVSSGTDTQLHLAAKSSNKHNRKNINDDEKVVKNTAGQEEFLTSDETDE